MQTCTTMAPPVRDAGLIVTSYRWERARHGYDGEMTAVLAWPGFDAIRDFGETGHHATRVNHQEIHRDGSRVAFAMCEVVQAGWPRLVVRAVPLDDGERVCVSAYFVAARHALTLADAAQLVAAAVPVTNDDGPDPIWAALWRAGFWEDAGEGAHPWA